MDFNNIFSWSLCLISGHLSADKNTINNYDSDYKIINNNTIKIRLKNYYEKIFFIASVENNFLSLFNSKNNFINCCKIN